MLILFGAPGCGKDTVAEKLIVSQKYKHIISMSNLLGKYAEKNTDIKAEMEKGNLISSEIVQEIIAEKIESYTEDERKNIILNGFPRTIEQAKFLKKYNVEMFIFISVPNEVCLNRISSRNQGRMDDNHNVALLRMKKFVEQSSPILDFFREQGKLFEINGDQLPAEVLQDTIRKIKCYELHQNKK